MATATGAVQGETTPLWDALVGVLFPAVLLTVVYWIAGTWSVEQTFGGEDAGGWVDFHGRPVDHPPLIGDAEGHPAAWVFVVVALVLIATAFWASRTGGRAARRRAWIGTAVAAGFVVVVILVFTVLQMHLVAEAFAHGSTRPPILGNATLVVAQEVEQG